MEMSFFVHRAGREFGPYTPEQLRRALAEGTLLSTDFCRRVDVTQWATVADYFKPAKKSLMDLLAEDDEDGHDKQEINAPARRVPKKPAAAAIAMLILAVASFVFWPTEPVPTKPEVKGTQPTAVTASANATIQEKKQGEITVDPHAQFIPEDSVAVMTIRVQDLLKKSKSQRIDEVPIWQGAESRILQYSPLAGRILRDATDLGLDLESPIHIFIKLQAITNAPGGLSTTIGVAAAVRDMGELDGHLPVIIGETLGGFGEAQARNLQREKDHWKMSSRNLPVALAFNQKWFVLVSCNTKESNADLDAVLKQTLARAAPLAKGNADFRAHLGKKKDAGLWLDMTAGQRLTGQLDSVPALEWLADTEILESLSIGFVFEKGAAELTMDLPLKKHNNLPGGQSRDHLLKWLPGNAPAALAFSLKADALRTVLRSSTFSLGTDALGLLPTIVGALGDGSGVAAITSLPQANETTEFIIATSKSNSNRADPFRSTAKAADWTLKLTEDNTAILASSRNRSFIGAGQAVPPLPIDRRDWLTQHAVAGYLNLSQLSKLADGTGNLFRSFRELRIGANEATPGKWKLVFRLLTNDPKAHSLRALGIPNASK